jgi:predicted DNA-binding transcriptional regulator AlpA
MENATVTANQPEATIALLGSDYLTPEQLAQALGFSPRTLARMHVSRQGPPRVVLGRTILYRRASVLEWLEARESKLERGTIGRRRTRR